MRFLIPMVLTLAATLPAMAHDDPELRHVLSLLSAAHIGDDYDAVKKLVPDVGALRPDAGRNNTEAVVDRKLGNMALHGEFNFSNGHLVSHGFSTGPLSHAEAHDFLLRCTATLERLYGRSERRIDLPSEHDGPRDVIGISFNWHRNRTLFGLDFHYGRDSSTISWGAQAE